ncbi:putative 2-oxoglutarate dehydrogenase E1 component DHKTD1, mitochondrial, partial [Araneus ventricosus]
MMKNLKVLDARKNEGEVTKEEISEMTSNYYNILNENLKLSQTHETKLTGMQVNWKKDSTLKDAVSVWDTGISVDLLKYVGAKSVQLPDNFSIHPTLEKNFVQERLKKLVKGNQIDWATAEALAVGSLLYQGGLVINQAMPEHSDLGDIIEAGEEYRE